MFRLLCVFPLMLLSLNLTSSPLFSPSFYSRWCSSITPSRHFTPFRSVTFRVAPTHSFHFRRTLMATWKDRLKEHNLPEEDDGDALRVPCPGDTLPWNLPKHQRIKRSKSASGEVLDPAERAVIRIAGGKCWPFNWDSEVSGHRDGIWSGWLAHGGRRPAWFVRFNVCVCVAVTWFLLAWWRRASFADQVGNKWNRKRRNRTFQASFFYPTL